MGEPLKPCPFCGEHLFRRGGVNDYGRCNTEGCWLNERKILIPIKDPIQVAAWNKRASPLTKDHQS